MEQDGQNSLRHIVSNGLIRISRRIAVKEAFDALPKARMLIRDLGQTGQRAAKQE